MNEENKPVCYFIDNVCQFQEVKRPKYRWINFKPDLCVGEVKDPNKAGMLSFKLSIKDITDEPNFKFKDLPAWNKKIEKRFELVNVRCYIYQCKDLPAADEDGASDPYIKVWDTTGEPKKTKVIEDNINPLFFEIIDLQFEVRNLSQISCYPPIIFEVYDEDKGTFGTTSDFLGKTTVFLDKGASLVSQESHFSNIPSPNSSFVSSNSQLKSNSKSPRVPRNK